MQHHKVYSAQDQYEYITVLKNCKTRCEVCDRDIATLQLKKHKETYSHFSAAKLRGVPSHYHFLHPQYKP